MNRSSRWVPAVVTVWSLAVGVWFWYDTSAGAVTLEPSLARPVSAIETMMTRSGAILVRPIETESAGVTAGAAAQQPAQGYAGEQTCVICHEDKQYAATPHGRSVDPRTPAATQGCESCHGPGQAHADAGGDPSLIRRIAQLPPPEASEACTACHNRGDHALWDDSPHAARNLSCSTCHRVHTPQSPDAQLVKATELETCAGCHRDKLAKLDRSGHMPVREGKLQCSSCHNPHGSQNVRMLRTGHSVNETCTSCHADKRGPFLWEHAPVRESCTNCHDPHGSGNERMLVSRTPILCQRCHAHTRHPSTIYDEAAVATSARVYARSCLTCHPSIHGSNHPSGQRFLR